MLFTDQTINNRWRIILQSIHVLKGLFGHRFQSIFGPLAEPIDGAVVDEPRKLPKSRPEHLAHGTDDDEQIIKYDMTRTFFLINCFVYVNPTPVVLIG